MQATRASQFKLLAPPKDNLKLIPVTAANVVSTFSNATTALQITACMMSRTGQLENCHSPYKKLIGKTRSP